MTLDVVWSWLRATCRGLASSRRARAGAAMLLAASCVALMGTGYDYTALDDTALGDAAADLARASAVKPSRSDARLRARIVRLKPRGRYIVVDQTNNRLYLRDADTILMTAVCSSGSGMVLKQADGASEWVFDTPRGRFEVLSRIEDPIWRKPDWAFVEAGAPVPTRLEDRFERGVLGEYALYFGNGFMIHGTLYERLLGRSVTHGCIRLGREDLRRLWTLTTLGTPIYIF